VIRVIDMANLWKLKKSNLAKEVNNLLEIKIPYSAEAVEYLIAIERYHFGGRPKGWWCSCCVHRINTPEDPCPNLARARARSSRETLIAATLILSRANNE